MSRLILRPETQADHDQPMNPAKRVLEKRLMANQGGNARNF
jgi:hypothetical protein